MLGRQPFDDALALMPDDDAGRDRFEWLGGCEDMTDERPSVRLMEDLRQ
jgi:hypothetical protein